MAIPFIDLSNAVKWFSGFGSGAPGDPYGLTVVGNLISVAVEITRPSDTSPYGIGDVISDSVSATTMQAIADAARTTGGSGYIVGMRASTDKKNSVQQLRIHFFNTNGATISVDNAAWQDKYADAGKRIAYYDLPAMTTAADTSNSDMSRSVDMTMRIPYTCVGTSLYFVPETLTAFTPNSGQKFTFIFFLDRN